MSKSDMASSYFDWMYEDQEAFTYWITLQVSKNLDLVQIFML